MRREGTWQDFRGAVFQCEWKDFSHAMLNYTFALNIILRSPVSCMLSIYMNLDKCFVLNISKKISAENQAIYDSQHEGYKRGRNRNRSNALKLPLFLIGPAIKAQQPLFIISSSRSLQSFEFPLHIKYLIQYWNLNIEIRSYAYWNPKTDKSKHWLKLMFTLSRCNRFSYFQKK